MKLGIGLKLTCFLHYFIEVSCGGTLPRPQSRQLLSHSQHGWSTCGGKGCGGLRSEEKNKLYILFNVTFYSYFPRGSVPSKEGKVSLEPVVNFVEGHVSSIRLIDGLYNVKIGNVLNFDNIVPVWLTRHMWRGVSHLVCGKSLCFDSFQTPHQV